MKNNEIEQSNPEASSHDQANTVAPSQRQRDELATHIITMCRTHGFYLAAAESLTGGLLADAFVRIPGASDVFLGSAVTYDIAAKASILHVDEYILDTAGAVDPRVAAQMAQSTAHLYERDDIRGRVFGLSTTGVAGPGSDGDKPAGMVYVGIYSPLNDAESEAASAHTVSYRLQLGGSRECVRLQTVQHVLTYLEQALESATRRLQ
ncbi:MAG: CinA family protein [Bifidobacterium aquikefiri]|uniref:Damage-inducible protein CinA n=1 Tax=Bifidobacterium aquikefiri TaxID=1653207 RepID=A0A261G687_9BIFI|nr:CinA family protein [Bifidobacterium aquikefiri]OZG66723.1 damage-inducible protein CinA [Bifidobacterium aquikefiri]